MNRRFWTGFAMLSMLVLIASYLALNLERTRVEVPVPPSAESRRDPFLLASRLLARLGVPTERLSSLDRADALPRDALLLVPAARGAISRTGITRLQRFVAAGGHLLVEAEDPLASDPVLDAFGIARGDYRWDVHEHRFDAGYDLGDKRTDYAPDWAGLVTVRLPPQAVPLRVRMDGDATLRAHRPLWRAGDRGGTRALQRRQGAGWVTAVNALSFASNHELARADNAEFLWQLVQTGAARRVLIYGGHTENLWHWLRHNAPAALLALGVLIALWLWQALPRFGPRLPDPEPVRRRLLDHLAASGRYLWSRGERARLVERASRHVQAALLQRHPHLAALPAAERAAFVAQRYALTPTAAMRLLEPGRATDGRDVIDRMRSAATLHRALAASRHTAPSPAHGNPHP